MSRYYISSHVHFAVFEDDTVVFLDLRSDQYCALSGPKGRTLKVMLSCNSDSIQELSRLGEAFPVEEQQLSRIVLEELLENRLLTTAREDGAPSARPAIAYPTHDLLNMDTFDAAPLTARDLLRFATSCLSAKWRLRARTIEATVTRLRSRKRAAVAMHAPPSCEVRRLVSVYNRLRPLFPRNYLCLFDSVAMLEFLAHYHCFPDMIFAVTLDPWGAHCWVQYGDVALNQDSEDARTYLPIMLV